MENTMLQYILSIVSGLVVTIPVVIQLVKYIKQAIQEKRWDLLMKNVVSFMVTAEEQFEKGSVKKDFVLVMAKEAADEIGIEFDEEKIGAMIDAMVAMSKVVNSPKQSASDEAVKV